MLSWSEILDESYKFNGYKYVEKLIETDRLPKHIRQNKYIQQISSIDGKGLSVVLITSFIGEDKIKLYNETGILDFTEEELRTLLFMQTRAAHWSENGEPSEYDIDACAFFIEELNKIKGKKE